MVSSEGIISHEITLDAFSSNDRNYNLKLNISGSCNSEAIAQCVPDRMCTVEISDGNSKITMSGICEYVKSERWESSGRCTISFTDCTITT